MTSDDMHAEQDAIDQRADRTTNLLRHLDGALQDATLQALHGVWSMLEGAAVGDESHARAVRERLFWQSVSPSSYVTRAWDPVVEPVVEGIPGVSGLQATWDDPEQDHGFAAAA